LGKPDNIEEVFRRYLDNEHSLQDLHMIQSYFQSNDGHDVLSALIERELAASDEKIDVSDRSIDRILSSTDVSIFSEINNPEPKHTWLINSVLIRAIAAILLVGISVGVYLYIGGGVRSEKIEYSDASVVLPGSNKAVLQLADGRTINLNEAGGEIIINADAIAYSDGSSIAQISKGVNHENALNTIATPKGGQYQIVLSDGTRVWLNANSSLRYPSKFSDKKRVVELTGEAFFEVNSQPTGAGKKIPFVVRSANQEVLVTGTQFNINAYEDESVIRTTLVEGKVHVTTFSRNESKSTAALIPGHQAVVAADGLVVVTPEQGSATAWKDGRFIFSNQSFETTMRQIARWYDVEFEFMDTGVSNLRLGGTVSRSTRLSTVLEAMSATEKVSFIFKANKIYVKSLTKP